MAIFVFSTDNCREEAATHGWQDRLDSFARDVEKKQTVRMFEHFPPPYIVKKKFGEYAGRLIAAHEAVGDDSVVVFLSAMIRGTGDYEAFSDDAEKYGRQHFQELYSASQLAKYVEQRKHKDPPPPKPPVAEDEYGYLHDVLHRAHGGDGGAPEEDLVAESQDWVQRCSEPAFQNYHAFFHQTVVAAENHEESGGKVVPVPGKTGYSVLLRNFPRLRLLWLGAPVKDGDKESMERLRKTYASVLDEEEPSLETVLKASRRAYPAVLLADDNLWMNLQKETEANMALSPEESKVLRSARRMSGPDGVLTGGFPMFINGRAGSGKTTILQYLFAEFLFYHLTKGQAGAPPLYFTCNPELLRNSREFVLKLLSCGASWWHYEGDRAQLVNENEAVFDGAFKEFHRHLLALVEPEERAKHFPPDKYVGYAKFKQLWTQRFGQSPTAKKEFGADISWHVIRSYIKGLSSDDLLVPNEYQHLDKKQLTVRQETFAAVHQSVWLNWYKPLSDTDGFWDDQDLARHLIEADDVRREVEQTAAEAAQHSRSPYGLQPVHPVIFCDESQDFTRIELEVILRLSLFAERALGRDEIALVPFIFAGDQFQTLNPTGFRWEAIKAFFVEKFILALAAHRPKSLDLNYRELTFNYRSSRRIVCFSNYVQALRARLFELTTLEPQQPWENEPNPPPVTCFERDDDQLWTQLKQASDLVVIVPCGEGEEMDYVRNDPVLRTKVGFNEDGTLKMTVVTAVGAKGLEFPRVVVYGFGEAADADLLAPLRDESKRYADDPDRSLPKQYFINRLYVAVSRAKKRLFIVDSTEGFRKLWDFAQDDALEDAILGGLRKGRETWGGAIARLEKGRVEDIAVDRAYDPIEIAVSLAADGRARSYAPHLLQAANIYKNNGQEQEAMRCRADAARIEGKFIEAAEQFLGCKDMQRATDCFWRAERPGWTALCKASDEHPDLIGRLEFGFARAITGKPTVTEAVLLLRRLDESLAEAQGRAEIASNPSWAVALRSLLDVIGNLNASKDEWMPVSELVEKIVASGVRIGPIPRAQLAYRAGQLAQAANLWDEAGERGSAEYKTARAFSAPYPEKLATLHEIGKLAEIVAEHGRHSGVALTPEQSRYVGRAYLQQHNYDLALPLLVDALDGRGIGDLIAGAQPLQPDLALKAGVAQLAVVATTGDWFEALAYVQGKSLPHIARPTAGLTAWMNRNKETFDLALMRTISRSDSILKLTWDAKRERVTQRPFAEYLLKAFFVKDRPTVAEEHLEELGAAIERAGSRMGAVRFYETIRDAAPDSSDRKRHARERWIVSKERQSQFAAQDGDSRSAGIQNAEAKRERERLGIKPNDKLDAFPKLDSLSSCLASVMRSTNTQPPSAPKDSELAEKTPEEPAPESKSEAAPILGVTDKAKKGTRSLEGGIMPKKLAAAEGSTPVSAVPEPVVAEPLRGNICGRTFEFFRQDRRLNVSADHGIMLNIRLGKDTCSSADLTVTVDSRKAKLFTVEEWNLVVDLTHSAAVVLEFVNEEIKLHFKRD